MARASGDDAARVGGALGVAVAERHAPVEPVRAALVEDLAGPLEDARGGDADRVETDLGTEAAQRLGVRVCGHGRAR